MTKNEGKSGFGVQRTWGEHAVNDFPNAFAIHYKQSFEGTMKEELDLCQKQLGCYAYYDKAGLFQLGCNRSKAITDYR